MGWYGSGYIIILLYEIGIESLPPPENDFLLDNMDVRLLDNDGNFLLE